MIHAASRLRIMTALAELQPGDSLSFPRLAKALAMTAGNLSTHSAKLEAAGYVQVVKTFEGRRPATYLSLTPGGRTAFAAYLANLRAIVGSAL